MMNKLKVIIGVVIISLLLLILVGCNTNYSDEEIEAEMENLTAEELTLIINEANQSEALVGESYYSFKRKHQNTKIYKIDPTRRLQIAKKVLESIKIGCYLKINDKAVWLTFSKSDCESLFIAEKFVGRQELYRLFGYFGYSNIDQEKVLDKGNPLRVYYKNQYSFDYFLGIQNKFSSNYCEKLSFFGVQTFCFNEIPAEKKSNFEYMIKYLTVLKYTSNVNHEILLTNQVTDAYSFILSDEHLIYYDGSQPESYSENFETIKCEEDQGPANFQNVGGENRVYICKNMVTLSSIGVPKRLFSASSIYHEAVHKYQQGHSYNLNCDSGNTGDKDFKSVMGAHINFLFSMSQNEILSCDERNYAFDEAEKLMKKKLCQVPNKPSHGFSVLCS